VSLPKNSNRREAILGLPLFLKRAGAGLAFALGLFAALAAAQGADPADPQDKAKIEAGANVYAARCATCHGDDLVNSGGQAFDLKKLRSDERARFENSVRHGKNQMPPWQSVLTDEAIDQLWHYIRANAY
jgi:mono/diheme cytochrome c family protein